MNFPFLSTGPHLSNWNSILERGMSISDPVTKTKLLPSLIFLRDKLGDQFLTESIKYKIDYLSNFTFALYWHSQSVIALATHIEAIQQSVGFEKVFDVFKTLTQAHRFHESLTLFETGYLLHQQFDLQFEPKIAGFNKNPDLKILNRRTSSSAYVEISELRESKTSTEAIEITGLFTQFFTDQKFRIFGTIHTTITLPEAIRIVNRINQEIESSIGNHCIYHYHEDDIIDFVAYDKSVKSEAQKIATKLNIPMDVFCGSPIEKSEWLRLYHKIFKEQKQLPIGHENIVIIWANEAMLEAQYRNIQTKPILEGCLQRYPHLSGIVILSTHPNESFDFNNNTQQIESFKNSLDTIYHYTCAFRSTSHELESDVLACLG